MTRIIGGTAGGRLLTTPAGDRTRPTSDRVREALFSLLEARGAIEGARVLDLFAGSGALGLEAASRGAAAVTLVDAARPAVVAARRNAAMVTQATGGLEPPVDIEVMLSTALRFLQRAAGPGWDLVLADPPYALGEDALAAHLDALVDRLAPQALVVVERGSRSPAPRWPAGLVPEAARRYGETLLWLAVAAGR